jgi:U3 small nucleolar ribonucleoprotein protein LCP5
MVDHMVEDRLVLEKIKVLEGRMKYQIDKLVRVVTEKQSEQNSMNGKNPIFLLLPHVLTRFSSTDPLLFRPNPRNLEDSPEKSDDEEGSKGQDDDGVYRPPKVAPMPYTEPRSKKDRRSRVPAALHTLMHTNPSKPHIETTSGLGNMAALTSKRTRELQEMAEWEETNMARLVMKKRDARRRAQDEADIALGGIGAGGRRGGGLADEFDDVLKSVSRNRIAGDGYEELRRRGKKMDLLSRAKSRKRDDVSADEADAPSQRKRSRFEKAIKASKARSKRK